MRSKKYLKLKSQVERKKAYSLEEAIELVKKTSGTKFDATLEVHLRLGIDPKKGEEQIRGTIVLPNSFGKSKIVAAFVEAGKEDEAKAAGADLVGAEEMIEEIAKTQKINFDVAVATPSMMPKLAKVAKILGPKGLMPNPKTETVGPNIKKIIEELKKGKLAFKNDDGGNIHVAVGKVSFPTDKILANLQAVLDVIKKIKPASSKGTYIKNSILTSTMGPAVKIQVV
ncbi:MAG: 50S ribosomal protein L1 [Candidatus Magasanikbacteria bacterium GW2011_GWC2_40_17]|uniref:Large ribosomal subunit protein uL1 n=1 Tax=Candidatus Magasanikbacteria bacterium GW2011_GWA2_42_32 TaxID=1619039 RepID=A0A0G1D589_9BACT|nr:MAG: 50S ribosomal protein L1 [Candidatus Magasanikbacteria bacterium GW2011_GWC2_40_17]KKS57183.1 MAG: 50S ribosomal protein L1 [Candidatus Magasanikbacteria bacterium GW2011_GWA2_42_32]OGH85297.1 MAG: 50S ribosomal protein L1 [Candidatus Magasanikbacteria bacterium RIFOXYB2_FULL_38_10]